MADNDASGMGGMFVAIVAIVAIAVLVYVGIQLFRTEPVDDVDIFPDINVSAEDGGIGEGDTVPLGE